MSVGPEWAVVGEPVAIVLLVFAVVHSFRPGPRRMMRGGGLEGISRTRVSNMFHRIENDLINVFRERGLLGNVSHVT